MPNDLTPSDVDAAFGLLDQIGLHEHADRLRATLVQAAVADVVGRHRQELLADGVSEQQAWAICRAGVALWLKVAMLVAERTGV